MFFRKKYNMDMNTANQTLQNVFAACSQAPNTVPFDKLMLKGLAQTALVTACKWIAAGFLLLILVAPLAFRNSDFSVSSKSFRESISITDHQLYEHEFKMVLNGSDVDYDNIYAKKPDGTFVFPSSVNISNDTMIVTIPYDGISLNIYIPDKNGKTLQAILSERK